MDLFSVSGLFNHYKSNFSDNLYNFNTNLKCQGIVEGSRSASEGNRENFGASSSVMEEPNPVSSMCSFLILLIMVCVVVSLYFWAIMTLYKFALPPFIKCLCVLFMLLGQPMYSIILAYLFDGANTSWPFKKTALGAQFGKSLRR